MAPHGPVERFRHCPACGAAAELVTGAGPFQCASCDFRLFFSPAAAVAVLLRRADGAVLFTKRAKDPGKGLLGMPGGFVDPGERAEEALVREVREEIGAELGEVRYLASFGNEYPYAGVPYNTLDIFFTAALRDPEAVRPLDAIEALVWRDPAGVRPEEIAFESMRRAVALYVRGGTGDTLAAAR